MPTALRKLVNSRGQIYYQSVHYKAPTVLRREGKMLALSFEYNAKMIAALKARIPRDSRWWDGDRGVWFIKPAYAQWVIGLVRDVLGQDITVTEEPL